MTAIALTAGLGGSHAIGAAPAQPNIIVIFSDDQNTKEMGPMPNVRNLIGGAGTTFSRFYITFPLCCPARASMLSGEYMHNHGVRGNFPPFGGWERFRATEPNTLPVWLDDAGYRTAYAGKYLNSYNIADGLTVPPGWDEWYGRIGNEKAAYYDYKLVEKGPSSPTALVPYGNTDADYSNDVYSEKALEFITRASDAGDPFLLTLSVSAPHHPFTPARRHLNAYAGAKITRPGFNEADISDKPAWLRREAARKLTPAYVQRIKSEERRRLETLLSLDEMTGRIIERLDDQGVLEDTYVIYTSDNGLFRGEHRIAGGKFLPHEPSSHVPFLIRGPGIPAGGVSDELTTNADLASTALEIAGEPDKPELDGRSLLPFAEDPELSSDRPILLEGDTGPGKGIVGGQAEVRAVAKSAADARRRKRRANRLGLYSKRGAKGLDQEKPRIFRPATGDRAPAYRAIRTDRYVFIVYATGDTELYDMYRDPAQLRSLARAPRYQAVRKYLFAKLVTLAACKAEVCRIEIDDPPPLTR